jgi:hypothetical protein
MSNQVEWLDRRIACPGPYMALCLNERQFAKACRKIRIAPPPFVRNAWSHATTHWVHAAEGLTVIVCLQHFEGRDPIEVAGLLVHEAVHIWQQYAESIGEDRPGTEQEAYAIQSISQALMASFVKQTAREAE